MGEEERSGKACLLPRPKKRVLGAGEGCCLLSICPELGVSLTPSLGLTAKECGSCARICDVSKEHWRPAEPV